MIEDHLLVQEAVSTALKAHSDIEIVASDTGEADFLRLIRETRPDVVIFDVGVGMHDPDPVAAVEAIRRTSPRTEVLALVGRGDGLFVRGIIEAGARGCLLKDDEQILSLGAVVRRISRGERVYSQEAMEMYFDLSNVDLRPQELTILDLVADGLSNVAIAERLGISSSTVRNCLSAVYAKLGTSQEAGVNPRVDAINRARQLGLL